MSVKRHATFFAYVVLCGLMTTTASAQSIAYVQGSRVSVRSQPSVVAPIADYVTTNSTLEVQDRTGDWCRIRSPSVPSLSGFIACRFLGDAPLTRAQIDARLADEKLSQRERLDWTMRRFWVAPSLRHLEAVGYAMEQTLLSDDTVHKEMVFGTTLRPPNAEFDAMKARLAGGVVASAQDVAPPTFDYTEPLDEALTRTARPAIRPSFFSSSDPVFAVALHPFTLRRNGADVAIELADALSAIHSVPYRTTILQPVSFYHGGPIGVWDIGRIGARFTAPVMLRGITSRGELSELSITSLAVPIGNQPCTDRSMRYVAKASSSRWDAAIVAWAGKAASANPVVKVTHVGAGKYQRLTVHTIDLNGDDISDFLIWTGLAPPLMDYEMVWKAVFANIGGRWTLTAYAQDFECT